VRRDCRDGLGQFGLADAGRPFDEQRLAEPGREEHHRGDVLVADVPLRGEQPADLFYGFIIVFRVHEELALRIADRRVQPSIAADPAGPLTCRYAVISGAR
jgi:hypothetical protein